ncbi:MAG: hypothetical protein ACI8R4_000761 [Paracoccaceae bacterium]|jgi:uncharacterized protein (DUF1499 family)
MGRFVMVLWILLAIVVVGLGYIRLAPSDPTQWHVAPDVSGDKLIATGATRLVQTGPDGLARLHDIALTTPRTSVLAGSVDAGMITYITRSKLFGFPDYITAQQDGDNLKILGRLRFGRSDMGVNGARLKAWVDALQP